MYLNPKKEAYRKRQSQKKIQAESDFIAANPFYRALARRWLEIKLSRKKV